MNYCQPHAFETHTLFMLVQVQLWYLTLVSAAKRHFAHCPVTLPQVQFLYNESHWLFAIQAPVASLLLLLLLSSLCFLYCIVPAVLLQLPCMRSIKCIFNFKFTFTKCFALFIITIWQTLRIRKCWMNRQMDGGRFQFVCDARGKPL